MKKQTDSEETIFKCRSRPSRVTFSMFLRNINRNNLFCSSLYIILFFVFTVYYRFRGKQSSRFSFTGPKTLNIFLGANFYRFPVHKTSRVHVLFSSIKHIYVPQFYQRNCKHTKTSAKTIAMLLFINLVSKLLYNWKNPYSPPLPPTGKKIPQSPQPKFFMFRSSANYFNYNILFISFLSDKW